MLGICMGLARHILGGGRGEYAGNMPGMEDVLGRGLVWMNAPGICRGVSMGYARERPGTLRGILRGGP